LTAVMLRPYGYICQSEMHPTKCPTQLTTHNSSVAVASHNLYQFQKLMQ
jgi:hypothetical protein